MEPDRWARVKEIFGAVIALRQAERSAFLSHVDEATRAEVLSLLAFHDSDAEALERPLLTTGAELLGDALEGILPPDRLGPYRVLEQIGRGGMGAVYRGVREGEPDRFYALKIIRPGLNQAALVRRFRLELRILRELKHEYVAGVLDSGVTPEGQPFFVMDLIEGAPVDRFCDDNLLSIRERLVLFAKICDAVQAAHSMDIVHRDLKPRNVLVSKDGTLKLLDFGIAKVATPALDARTVELTATGHRLMTPEYASPEQIRGEFVTAASDVYSLGVLLYELLAGHRPYRLERETPQAMMNAVCEQEAIKPSSRFRRSITSEGGGKAGDTIAAISSKRATTPRTLQRRLKGKLDNIVLKSLAKDPTHRYQCAGELADDVRRYLQRRPVTARGKSLATHFRQALRRRSTAATAGGMIAGAAIAAAFLWRSESVHQPAPARPAPLVRRSVAVLGFRDLRGAPETAWLSTAVSEMLSTELRAGQNLRIASGEDVARANADIALGNHESYRAATLKRIHAELGCDLVIAGSYLDSGKAGAGELQLQVTVQDARSGETLASIAEQGDEAHLFELVSRTGSDIRTRLGIGEPPPQLMDAVRASIPTQPEVERLYSQGLDRQRLYDYREARRALEHAVQIDPTYPLAHAALAEVLADLGMDRLASEQAKAAFDSSGKMLREGRLWVEGEYRMTTHEYAKAVEVYETLLKISPDDLDYGLRLALAEVHAGNAAQALAVLANVRKLPRPLRDDPRLDLAEAEAAEAMGEHQHAYDAAHRAAEKARGVGARQLLSRATLMEARTLAQLGRYPEAFATVAEARRQADAVGDTRGAATATRVLGRMFLDKTDLTDARETFADAYRLFSQIGDEAGVALVLRDQSAAASVAGDTEAALRIGRMAEEKARVVGDPDLLAHALNSVGVDLYLTGDLAQAVPPLEECIQIARSTSSRSALLFGTGSLGEVKLAQGDFDAAARLLAESAQIGQASGETRGSAYAQLFLARALSAQGKTQEAQKNVAESLAVWRERQDAAMIAYSQLVGVELALALGEVPDAEQTLRAAIALFAAKRNPSFEMQGYTVLLRLLTAQRKIPEADRVIEKMNRGFGGHPNFGFELDARLAIAEALLAGGRRAEGESKLHGVISAAKNHGYGRDLAEAQQQLARLNAKKNGRQLPRLRSCRPVNNPAKNYAATACC